MPIRFLLPGKDKLDAETFEQFTAGDEREAYVAARRAAGVTREAVLASEDAGRWDARDRAA